MFLILLPFHRLNLYDYLTLIEFKIIYFVIQFWFTLLHNIYWQERLAGSAGRQNNWSWLQIRIQTTGSLPPHSSLLTPHSSLLTSYSSFLTQHSSLLTACYKLYPKYLPTPLTPPSILPLHSPTPSPQSSTTTDHDDPKEPRLDITSHKIIRI